MLRPKESARTIKRVLLEPDTVRRMVEPDFDKEKPKQCKDVLILYATTEESDYEPLTQTAIELSYRLSTRSPNPPDVSIETNQSSSEEALENIGTGRCAGHGELESKALYRVKKRNTSSRKRSIPS